MQRQPTLITIIGLTFTTKQPPYQAYNFSQTREITQAAIILSMELNDADNNK